MLSRRKMLSRVAVLVAVLLVVVGALGIVFIQPLLKLTQDIRQQASSGTGTVLVRATTTSTLVVGQEIVVNLQVNTQGLQTDGTQVVFDITGGGIDSVALSTPNTSLSIIGQNVQRITNGFRVQVATAPQSVGTGFSTTAYTNFVRLRFTPVTADTIRITFDPSQSIATSFGTTPPQDVLRTITAANFVVTAPSVAPTPSPSPSIAPSIQPTPSPSIAPTPTPSPSPVVSPSPTPSASASPAVTPTPSPTPSTTTLAADLNHDGKVNLLDYQIMNQEFFRQLSTYRADINRDGRVDLLDYTILNRQFSIL